MPELDDHGLLADYVRHESQEAFATLVRRYVNLVYSTALRFTGNAHHAEEITQAVFIILARKAAKLSPRTVMSGWLYQAARLTAANFVKREMRRQRREQEAYVQSTLNESDAAAWEQIAPLLDEAMGRLGETDRNAVVLRFFENKTAAEVAVALKTTEAAIHKRVSRALEKLRKIFIKRGFVISAATVGAIVSANSIHAAPIGLAASITATAAKGSAVAASTLTLVKGALKVMAWTKVKTAMAVGIGLLVASGTTTVVVEKIKASSSAAPSWTDDPKYWELDFKDTQAVFRRISGFQPVFVLRRTHFPNGYGFISIDGKMVGKNEPISQLLRTAYDPTYTLRLVLPPDIPTERLDIMATLPDQMQMRNFEKLQEEMRRRFGLTAHLETNDMEVFLLKRTNPNSRGLIPTSGHNPSASLNLRSGKLAISNWPLSGFASQFDSILKVPVFDETEISGNYDCDLSWTTKPGEGTGEAFKRAVAEQLGLEFEPSRRTIKVLKVEHINH